MSAFSNKIHPAYIYPNAQILLADDMRMNVRIFQELLKPWQMKIDVVTNGREAVEAVHKQHYQMIFLDQMMPEMMGNQAAEIIHQYCDTPIILVTSDLREDDIEEYHRCGGVEVLAKPIEVQVLEQILDTYMPREYRCDVHSQKSCAIMRRDDMGVSKNTLETFAREIRLLARDLPEYAKQDMDLFRVKVHGVKGSSRQIGKTMLSEAAEAMEMAARAKDDTYINAHMQEFRLKILTTVQELETEWEEAIEQIEVSEAVEQQIGEDAQDVKRMFELLHAGFDGYCMEQIESNIRALEHAKLSQAERELLIKAKRAYEDLEYEAGSALFS